MSVKSLKVTIIITVYFYFSGAILRSMARRKIISADVGYKGTQLKMSIILEGGQRAVFKPKWLVSVYKNYFFNPVRDVKILLDANDEATEGNMKKSYLT